MRILHRKLILNFPHALRRTGTPPPHTLFILCLWVHLMRYSYSMSYNTGVLKHTFLAYASGSPLNRRHKMCNELQHVLWHAAGNPKRSHHFLNKKPTLLCKFLLVFAH